MSKAYPSVVRSNNLKSENSNKLTPSTFILPGSISRSPPELSLKTSPSGANFILIFLAIGSYGFFKISSYIVGPSFSNIMSDVPSSFLIFAGISFFYPFH